MFFFFFVVASAITLEDKEDFCYLLAVKHMRDRTQEIEDFLSSSKVLQMPSLRAKLLEDTFNSCVEESKLDYYAEDLVLKYFDRYKDLVKAPLDKYKTLQDVKVSQSFSKNKPDIIKRATMKPRSFREF